MKILVTGGVGFIGAAIVKHLQEHEVHILDNLSYAADTDRLRGLEYRLFVEDICEPITSPDLDYDYILHLAAETHVDNSIEDPLLFVRTNVLGTANVLEFARKQKKLKKFLYFSTDEVFGPAPDFKVYREWDRYNSGNPYSAAKAGGEELALAYGNTYKLPVIITHTMNAFGPTQHVEKFIPETIRKVMNGETVIIHASPDKKISGSRFYIHTDNIARAVKFVLKRGTTQDKYNIVGEKEVSNLEVAQKVAKLLDKPLKYEMVDFHSSRPGHDLRYGLDGTRLREMGFELEDGFDKGLEETVNYYKEKYETNN